MQGRRCRGPSTKAGVGMPVLALVLVVAAGCGKKGGSGGPDCSGLYDKMTECSKTEAICGLGIQPMPKNEWVGEMCSPADAAPGWTKVQKRCFARACEEFCPCLNDTLAAHNGITDVKVWDEIK